MTIAIHQPNYLPWIGYFYKIYASDIFVFLDDVAFSKGSYTNRCQVRVYDDDVEPRWLTLPLGKVQLGTDICDIEIAASGWSKSHFSIINAYYRDAPFYSQTIDLFRELFSENASTSSLAELNIRFIEEISQYLNLNTKLVRSSNLNIKHSSQERLMKIVKAHGGSEYLSGTGASAYQEEEPCTKEGINLVYHHMSGWLDLRETNGDSMFGKLSIVDTLMRIGQEGVLELLENFRTDRLSHLSHSEVKLNTDG